MKKKETRTPYKMDFCKVDSAWYACNRCGHKILGQQPKEMAQHEYNHRWSDRVAKMKEKSK